MTKTKFVLVVTVLISIVVTACGPNGAKTPPGEYQYVPPDQSNIPVDEGVNYATVGPLASGQWILIESSGAFVDGAEVGKGDKCVMVLIEGPTALTHKIKGAGPIGVVTVIDSSDADVYPNAMENVVGLRLGDYRSYNSCKDGIDYLHLTKARE